ncbi:MAG: hypothetical protein M1830_005295 [Pleopsidium flavum]|nr:MAG: hypothetical protein M1830_005295 [Pleopsidium flavum]
MSPAQTGGHCGVGVRLFEAGWGGGAGGGGDDGGEVPLGEAEATARKIKARKTGGLIITMIKREKRLM